MNNAVEVMEHNGYTIKVWYDPSPFNPWEEGDCELPVLILTRDFKLEYGVEDRVPDFDVRKHWREALDILDVPKTLNGLKELKRGALYAYSLEDAILEALESYVEFLGAPERLGIYAEVYGWMGIRAFVGYTTGYCQGDYAYVLVVATPEWVERVGAPSCLSAQDLEYAVDLAGDWLWGNTYGFTVLDSEGEEVDSCWGYFGSDHEASGLLYAARRSCHVVGRGGPA